MKFSFEAKNPNGQLIKGHVEALNRNDAVSLLQEKGLVPIAVDFAAEKSGFIKEISRLWEGASQKDLVILFRQLSALISAKVPVLIALRTLQQQMDNKYLKLVMKDIADDVEDGMPLSDSFAKHPNTFSPFIINMMKAGEMSGNLQNSVLFIADNIEQNYDLNSKIATALMYPAFVIAVAIFIGFVVLTSILPQISEFIRDFGVPTPWYTNVVMALGDFMAKFWWAVLTAMFGAVFAAWHYVNTDNGKQEWDVIKLRIPAIGDLLRAIYMTRFASNISLLLTSGIPLVRALIIVAGVVDNHVYRTIILKAADDVKKGGNISDVMRRSADIPPIVSQMIEIGEEYGQLSETMKNTATFYQKEVDNKAKVLTSLIEPIMIVVLGLMVGLLVFAVLVPIFSIAGSIQ